VDEYELKNPRKQDIYDPVWVESHLEKIRFRWRRGDWIMVAGFVDDLDSRTWEWPEDKMETRRKINEALKPKLEELIDEILKTLD
jgi:hypothetical protein